MKGLNSESGQTLILMLIVTALSLVIGAAISSRAVSTLKQTSYTAQAGKAQKFADAGAEEALALSAAELDALVGTPVSRDVDGVAGNDVTYTVTRVGGGATVEASLEKDQTVQIDLTGYPSSQAVNIYWNAVGETDRAALVLAFIYDDAGTTKLEKYAYDPDAVTHANNFSVPSSAGPYSIGGKNYNYFAQINTPTGTNRIVRVRPLYNSVANSLVIQATGANTFPNQGYTITSTGTYGEAQWTVEVTKMDPALPAIFDYAIFTESDLTK